MKMFVEKATPELFAAIAEAQLGVENATKSSVNPHFKSRYADLAEVLNTVRPVYASKGLSIVQVPSFAEGLVTVTTVIGHKTGGWIGGELSCTPARTDAQGVGAASTYLRRYLLAAMTGVAQEDDDGNTASGRHSPQEHRPEPPRETVARRFPNIPEPMEAVLIGKLREGKISPKTFKEGFGEPTAANINKALEWISKQPKPEAS